MFFGVLPCAGTCCKGVSLATASLSTVASALSRDPPEARSGDLCGPIPVCAGVPSEAGGPEKAAERSTEFGARLPLLAFRVFLGANRRAADQAVNEEREANQSVSIAL